MEGRRRLGDTVVWVQRDDGEDIGDYRGFFCDSITAAEEFAAEQVESDLEDFRGNREWDRDHGFPNTEDCRSDYLIVVTTITGLTRVSKATE